MFKTIAVLDCSYCSYYCKLFLIVATVLDYSYCSYYCKLFLTVATVLDCCYCSYYCKLFFMTVATVATITVTLINCSFTEFLLYVQLLNLCNVELLNTCDVDFLISWNVEFLLWYKVGVLSIFHHIFQEINISTNLKGNKAKWPH